MIARLVTATFAGSLTFAAGTPRSPSVTGVPVTANANEAASANVAVSVLSADAVWEGEVSLTDDVVIPAGRSLVLRPGATVRVARRSGTAPGTTSPLVEVLVRGRLVAEGRVGAPVRLLAVEPGPAAWAGIVVEGGEVELAGTEVRDAEAAVTVMAGHLTTRDCEVHHGVYGVVADEGATVLLAGGSIHHLVHGVAAAPGATVTVAGVTLADNTGRNRLKLAAAPQPLGPPAPLPAVASPGAASRTLTGGALRGETVLAGRVTLAGTVEVPSGSSLVLRPGTLVEARRGAGLRVAGALVAKGTLAAPIVLRSALADPRPGDWSGIAVTGAQATADLEHVVVRDAGAALEVVGGELRAARSTLAGNLRGVELRGARATLRDLHLDDNGDGLQAQGGSTSIEGGTASRNGRGLLASGGRLEARGLTVAYNRREGARARGARLSLAQCTLHGNRAGLVAEAQSEGELRGLVVSGNRELGVWLEGAGAMLLRDSALLDNGLAGARLAHTAASLAGNLVAGNAHGIVLDGFTGTDEATSFGGNGSCAYQFEGGPSLRTRDTFVASSERLACACACDGAPTVELESPRTEAPPFVWPTTRLVGEVRWRGVVALEGAVVVGADAALRLAASTRVLAGDGASLAVEGGSLQAAGEPGREVLFRSRTGRRGAWRGVDVRRGVDTWLRHAVIEDALAPVAAPTPGPPHGAP